MNVLDGGQWSGWKAMPAGTTNLAGAATTYEGKLCLFGIGIGDHAHYFNVFDGMRWNGWKLVPGGGTSDLPIYQTLRLFTTANSTSSRSVLIGQGGLAINEAIKIRGR